MALLTSLLIGGHRAKRKARKSQERANRLERRRRAIANVTARRQAAASLRRQQAGILAASVAQSGVQGSSAGFNTASNIVSQGEAQIANQDQLEQLDQQRFDAQDLANRKLNQSENFNQGFGLALKAGKAIATGGTSGLDFTNPGG